ncbi:MAG: carbohydrate-binding domain-containing protein [Lachnospiraceae bacterium]|nr:carbohydrate-binding domain-containing protein [Lachnospiraceae bacterium]
MNRNKNITHKFAKKTAAIVMSGMLIAGGAFTNEALYAYAQTVTQSATSGSYNSTTANENAVLVDGTNVTLTDATVTKSGSGSGENADFYGTNAAVLATNGATLTMDGGTVTTNGAYANGVFSYGSGTTVNVSDVTINTSANNSGGIMTTGGATMNASDLTVTTQGGSSAAIRSDRGGGDVNVTGGSFTTTGVGSPAIYSTADIEVTNASLQSNVSEAVVVEGGNSVTLNNCTVTASNTQKNGQCQTYQNVMLYQSMSGDASDGTSSFTMNGGSMSAANGTMFYVTNTTSTITLSNATLATVSGDLLLAAAGPWGSSGSNGGKVTMNASAQELNGAITVDSSSALNLVLSNGSTYSGAINTSGQAGSVYVSVPDGCAWTLTGDSFVTSLSCGSGSINLNGHSLYVNGNAYEAGTQSEGEAISMTSSSSGSSSNGTPGEMPNGAPGEMPSDMNGFPGEPPEGMSGETFTTSSETTTTQSTTSSASSVSSSGSPSGGTAFAVSSTSTSSDDEDEDESTTTVKNSDGSVTTTTSVTNEDGTVTTTVTEKTKTYTAKVVVETDEDGNTTSVKVTASVTKGNITKTDLVAMAEKIYEDAGNTDATINLKVKSQKKTLKTVKVNTNSLRTKETVSITRNNKGNQKSITVKTENLAKTISKLKNGKYTVK